jgi:hypothetical protein
MLALACSRMLTYAYVLTWSWQSLDLALVLPQAAILYTLDLLALLVQKYTSTSAQKYKN